MGSKSWIGLLAPVFPAIGLVLSDALPFDPREATISSTHQALFTGSTTCHEVVSSFLSRIESLNHHTNAIISLNPNALDVAAELDVALQANRGPYGSLFCIPTILKDNFDTADMPTTGGNRALANSQPSSDAPTVKALKDAGAIIIGKANLHELALEGISVSSLGGQTINPYDKTRTPGGSSGGTGAAVAASFAVWGTGTDTVNSLRSPASANSLFSCKPTRGLITRSGVMPVSHTQDTVGPIGRCVEDIAIALTVMASVGLDGRDNATALAPTGVHGVDYSAKLTKGSLSGLRLGVLEGFCNFTESSETTPVNDAMITMILKLKDAGATIVPIRETFYNATAILKLDVQRYEYREAMDAYLQDPELKGTHPRSVHELFSPDSSDFLVIPAGYEYVNTLLVSSTSNETYPAAQKRIDTLTLALQQTFTSSNLDALIYPQQKNLVVPIGSPSQSGRNGILAALTGSPVIAVPVGFSEPTKTAPRGIPIGMEILGRPWTEELLLQIAWKVQGLGQVRRTPMWAEQVVEVKGYGKVPQITPDTGNIPHEYPLGVL